MASDNEVRLQLKGGRTIKIVRTETPTGGVWSIPEMPEIAAHQNISVIRDRLRGKGLIASCPGAPDTFAVEDRFYFGKGRKAKMARNSEYDTDGVKNLIHKETRDAEWGIDLYKGARAGNQYHAYHAFIGESVTTRVFGSRSEAEAWLNKKNAAGHPNKRKNSRSGGKAKFANSNEVRAIVVGLDKAISSLSQLPGDQSIRGPIAKVIQQLIAVQESARRLS